MLGRPHVRALVAAGHEVVGTTRSADRVALIAADGGRGMVCDALDRDAVMRAVAVAEPELLPALAAMLGAKPPRHVPAWLVRAIAGAPGVANFTELRGASNKKAKQQLGWQPRYPSWREGIAAELAR